MSNGNMEKYTEAYVGTLLGIAISRFYEHDWYLAENGIAERAMTHRLAVYLESLFIGFDVDCEYNRVRKSAIECIGKEIFVNCLECKEANGCLAKAKFKDCEVNAGALLCHPYVYPDVIVHIRGKEKFNLLVIEAKKNYGSVCAKDFSFDHCKLKCYREQLKYRYSAFIPFAKTLSETLSSVEFFVGKSEATSSFDFQKIPRIPKPSSPEGAVDVSLLAVPKDRTPKNDLFSAKR